MATLTIDSYKFIQRLIAAGIPEPQAKAIMDGLRNDIDLNQVATKEDIALLRTDVEKFKTEFFKWLVPVLLGQAGFIVALIKFM